MSAPFSFSHQFAQRWLRTPKSIRRTIMQELHDIIVMLDDNTDLDHFQFHVENLDDTIAYLMATEKQTINNQTLNPFPPTSEKPKETDTLLAKQQEQEARLIKQLTEQAKITEPLPSKKANNQSFSPLQNPFNNDIDHIKQQIINDIKQQITTDIQTSLLSWLNDEVEKQVNEKLKHLL